jgi:hypothetical protein
MQPANLVSLLMNLAAIDTEEAAGLESSRERAFAAVVGLARTSRLNLLYYRPDQAGAGGRALLQAAAQHGGNAIALRFDEWEEAPLPLLQQRLDEAVSERDPDAAPYFGDLPGAIAHWNDAQGAPVFLILDAFEKHLERNAELPDVAEFDRALIRLASDPMLELNILLCIDENAAPALNRLRPFLPDLGEDYLRMPELAGAQPQQPAQQELEPPPEPTFRPRFDAAPPEMRADAAHAGLFQPDVLPEGYARAPAVTGPAEPALPLYSPPDAEPQLPIIRGEPLAAGGGESGAAADATETADAAPRADHEWQRQERSNAAVAGSRRRFSSLLETLHEAAPPMADGADGADHATGADRAAGALPARRYPWGDSRMRRRRLATLRLAINGIGSATVLCFVLLIAAALSWELPQLASAPRTAEPAAQPQRVPAKPAAKGLTVEDVAKALGLRLHRASDSDPDPDAQ